MNANSEHSDIHISLRKRVFKLLNKNSILKPKQICKLLGESYAERGEVVSQYKKQWKKEYKNQQGSIRSIPDDLHNTFYKGKLPVDFVGLVLKCLRDKRQFCVEKGLVLDFAVAKVLSLWKPTRSRNRYWYFKNSLGNIRLFENGTVELWVRKPASDGKAKGLFTQAFVWTRLIDSIQICENFYKTLMRKMHGVFDYGQPVPYMKITAFKETHGFTFVSGDKSHPTCAEFMFEYHTEVFNARRLFEQMSNFFEQFNSQLGKNGGPKPLDQDYSS